MIAHKRKREDEKVAVMMTYKRKREDEKVLLQSIEDFKRQFSSAISTHKSPELAVLWVMQECIFDLSYLRQCLSDEGLNVSFSKVKYYDIAGLVGLANFKQLKDATTFDLHRSRIPTHLFKSIVGDMDVQLLQYGPPKAQETEATTCRFLSPIFNRLVAQFGFVFKNLPEYTIQGRITTKGRIEHYFKAFGPVSFMVIEVKSKIYPEHLDAIAQVIAELYACDWYNASQGFRVPILCDQTSFEFFCFDAETSPSLFTRGHLPGDSPYRHGLPLRDFSMFGPAEFIRDLRQISEVTFDLLLRAYTSSLTSFRDHVERPVKRDGSPGESLELWDKAVKHAQEALAKFRDAETKHQGQDTEVASRNVEEGMKALKVSVELLPPSCLDNKTDLLMSGWDEAKVEIQ